jgi:hypothetical protein
MSWSTFQPITLAALLLFFPQRCLLARLLKMAKVESDWFVRHAHDSDFGSFAERG